MIVFAFVVLIVALLLVLAVDQLGLQGQHASFVKLLIFVLAVVIICNRAGLL